MSSLNADSFSACKLLIFVFLILLSGCVISPTHPSLKDVSLKQLIPVRDFIADSKWNGNYIVSPDGTKLAWLAADGLSISLFVKTTGHEDIKKFGVEVPRQIKWAGDSRHVLLINDKDGNENTHIYVLNIEQSGKKLTDLTPYEETTARIVRIVQGGPEIIVEENHRNKKIFDLNKIDIDSGKVTVLATNPGDVSEWIVDRKGNLVARIYQIGTLCTLQVNQSTIGEDWKSVAEWSIVDECSILGVNVDGKELWALSNRGRDKISLVKITLATGNETVVYAEPDFDLADVLIGPMTRVPLFASSESDYPKNKFFDLRLGNVMLGHTNGQPAMLKFDSIDDQEQSFTVSVRTDQGMKHYLGDTRDGKLTLLGQDKLSRMASMLGTVKPISFRSRDGLELHGYLSIPVGVKAEKLPMVIMVHGGPFHIRDSWAYDIDDTQFLTNRGYAVLRVNYRGSAGYGREFREKAIGEIAGKMQDDLIDGLNWAVESGIGDPQKIAILGASYGGYATLMGLALFPAAYACGIDMFGPSNLARLLESIPEKYEFGKQWWYLYVGNPGDPEDRKRMDAMSPIYKVENITNPILIMHGINDPRVKLSQADEMVLALRKAHKRVEYVTFSGDGHGNRRWSNRLTMYRKTEDFLADCLGGRSSGFDWYQLMTWAE